jgi:hypothetical protein
VSPAFNKDHLKCPVRPVSFLTVPHLQVTRLFKDTFLVCGVRNMSIDRPKGLDVHPSWDQRPSPAEVSGSRGTEEQAEAPAKFEIQIFVKLEVLSLTTSCFWHILHGTRIAL